MSKMLPRRIFKPSRSSSAFIHTAVTNLYLRDSDVLLSKVLYCHCLRCDSGVGAKKWSIELMGSKLASMARLRLLGLNALPIPPIPANGVDQLKFGVEGVLNPVGVSPDTILSAFLGVLSMVVSVSIRSERSLVLSFKGVSSLFSPFNPADSFDFFAFSCWGGDENSGRTVASVPLGVNLNGVDAFSKKGVDKAPKGDGREPPRTLLRGFGVVDPKSPPGVRMPPGRVEIPLPINDLDSLLGDGFRNIAPGDFPSGVIPRTPGVPSKPPLLSEKDGLSSPCMENPR